MSAFIALLRRDLTLAFRVGGGPFLGLAFFLTVTALLPLGVGARLGLLGEAAAGFLWVAAALAALLSLDRLFQADAEDGTLDQLALGSLPLELAVLAKCLAHWLTTGLPLAFAAPVLALLLNMPIEGYLPLTLSLLIGSPVFSLAGAIGAALTAGLRRGGLLLSLLVLPLFVPVVIFGAGTVSLAMGGQSNLGAFLFLGAASLFALVLAPLAAAAALRIHLS
ncbi:Heme exporter protein B [Alphaproteobacteria bacterium SO-S41]|nr:Heme exporter protein B [Alphaproteobacteria bacterium SO-S41]